MKDVFLKLMFNIPKSYMTFTRINPFRLKKWKLKMLKNLCPTSMIKRNMSNKYDIFQKIIKSPVSNEKSVHSH